MRYYQQYLPDKGSAGAITKRAFQIVGLIHFILSVIGFIYFAFIYWTFLIIPAVVFVSGLFWGSFAYLFSKDYLYVFDDGLFAVYYKTSHGKYALIIKGKAKITDEVKSKKLTNKKEGLTVEIDGKNYKISPDGLMQTLIRENE